MVSRLALPHGVVVCGYCGAVVRMASSGTNSVHFSHRLRMRAASRAREPEPCQTVCQLNMCSVSASWAIGQVVTCPGVILAVGIGMGVMCSKAPYVRSTLALNNSNRFLKYDLRIVLSSRFYSQDLRLTHAAGLHACLAG